MKFTVVIPARHGSSRLPGKPLLDIAGKPMIQHVHQRALDSGARQVIIATDDRRIAEVAQQFGAMVCMTSADHPTGTDRLAEVIETMKIDEDSIVVNLQGDEPLMPAALIHQVAEGLQHHPQASVATLCVQIHEAAELFDPHAVKVVMDKDGYALYFSRAAMPWDRDAFSVSTDSLPQRSEHYRHLGLYAYRAGFVRQYVHLARCALEEMESLEQLRVLWHGYRIHVGIARERPGHGVDTASDLERVRQLMQ
ncbi:MAG: 3-deoxy-manno-octulosonate cytidylyltransferase [Gammaproteobacteria bacterium]|nr:3-deoxy-manno-octulosonate cytidylyltransferase [Gammaproteobacteria bacterium]